MAELTVDEFLDTQKVHNRCLDACFNDALAVSHLRDLINKEQVKLLQPLFDEASYASERAERKDLHSNVDDVLYLIESELAKLKGGETE